MWKANAIKSCSFLTQTNYKQYHYGVLSCGRHQTQSGPALKWGWGTDPAQSAGTKIFLVVPSTCLAIKVQLVVLVSAFVMVCTVWSVSCLLFFFSRYPPCPAICKSGGTCPPCPIESAPLPSSLHISFHSSLRVNSLLQSVIYLGPE